MAVPKKKRSISVNRNRNYIKLKNSFGKKLQSLYFLEKKKMETYKFLFNKLFLKFLNKKNNPSKKNIDRLFVKKLLRIPSFFYNIVLFFNYLKKFDKFIILYYSYYFENLKINSKNLILNFDSILSKKIGGKKLFCQQNYLYFLLFNSK